MRLVASTESSETCPAAARSRWPSRLVVLGCLAGGLWLAGLAGHSQQAQADPARPLPLPQLLPQSTHQPSTQAAHRPAGPLNALGEALHKDVADVRQVADGVLSALPAGSISLTPDITVTLPIPLPPVVTPPVVTPPVVTPPVVTPIRTPPVAAPAAHPHARQAKPAAHPAAASQPVEQPARADAGTPTATTPPLSTARSKPPASAGQHASQPAKPPRPAPAPIDPTGYLAGDSEATSARGSQDSPQLMTPTDARPVYRPLVLGTPRMPSPAAADRAERPPVSPD